MLYILLWKWCANFQLWQLIGGFPWEWNSITSFENFPIAFDMCNESIVRREEEEEKKMVWIIANICHCTSIVYTKQHFISFYWIGFPFGFCTDASIKSSQSDWFMIECDFAIIRKPFATWGLLNAFRWVIDFSPENPHSIKCGFICRFEQMYFGFQSWMKMIRLYDGSPRQWNKERNNK